MTFVLRVLAALVLATAVPAVAGAQAVRLNESLDELEARARRDSLDPAAHYNLAIGYVSRRHWARADTALERATALDPQFAVAWLARAVVRDRDDRYWEALRRGGSDSTVRDEARRRAGFARRAYLLDPFVDLRILATVFRFDPREEDAVRYYYGRDAARYVSGFRAGVQGLVEGDYVRAYNGFNQATVILNTYRTRRDSLPEDLLFLHTLAAAHAGRFESAIATAQTLLGQTLDEERKDTSRVTPLRTNEYRYVLAVLQQRHGALEEAMRLYRQVAEEDLGNYMAHVQLARLHEAARDWAAAIAERRAAAAANPEDHTMHLDLGALLARTGHLEEAEEALLEAQQLNARDSRVHYRLGVVQQLLGQTGEARASFERFIATAPSRYASVVADARARLDRLGAGP